MRSFAISDIHGCAKTFIALVKDVLQLTLEDQLYLLGDYIDRGPDSKGVIDFIWKLREDGYHVHTLKGNHEEMLLQSFQDEVNYLNWFRNGGENTMKSFGISQLKDLPIQYIDFFNSLKYYVLQEKFILVHAGINFESPTPLDDTESMLWIRRFTVDPKISENRIVVHGHTPTALFEIQEKIASVRSHLNINIDNGCFSKSRPFYGHLCALQLNNLSLHLQENID